MKLTFAIVLLVVVATAAESAGRRMLQLQGPRFTGTNQELDALVEWILQGGLKNSKSNALPVIGSAPAASSSQRRQQQSSSQSGSAIQQPSTTTSGFRSQSFTSTPTYFPATSVLTSPPVNYSPYVVSSQPASSSSLANCLNFNGV